MTAQPAVSKEMVQIVTRILYALTAVVTLTTGVLWIMNFQAIIEHGSLVKRVVFPVLTLSNGLVLVIQRRQLDYRCEAAWGVESAAPAVQ